MVGVAAATAVTVAIGVIRATTTSPPASAPPTSPVARQYQRLSEQTLRACPPSRTDLTTFTSCIQRFEDGLHRLTLPASVTQATAELLADVQLVRTCVAEPYEDGPSLRTWPVGCPQKGPAPPAAATTQDEHTPIDLYRSLLFADETLRQALGLPTPTP